MFGGVVIPDSEFSNTTSVQNDFILVDSKKDPICSDPMAQVLLKTQLKQYTADQAGSTEELHAIIQYPPARQVFYEFLCNALCEENLEFYLAVQRLKDFEQNNEEDIFSDSESSTSNIKEKKRSSYALHAMAIDILERFLTDTAPKPINIDFYMRENLLKTLESDDPEYLIQNFTEAQNVIYSLLLHDAFPKYRDGKLYKEFRESLLNQEPVDRRNSSDVKKLGKDKWVPDKETSQCMACSISFTLLNRRHHCRVCGKLVCNKCSSNKIWGTRACDECYETEQNRIAQTKQAVIRGSATSRKRTHGTIFQGAAPIVETIPIHAPRKNSNNEIELIENIVEKHEEEPLSRIGWIPVSYNADQPKKCPGLKLQKPLKPLKDLCIQVILESQAYQTQTVITYNGNIVANVDRIPLSQQRILFALPQQATSPHLY